MEAAKAKSRIVYVLCMIDNAVIEAVDTLLKPNPSFTPARRNTIRAILRNGGELPPSRTAQFGNEIEREVLKIPRVAAALDVHPNNIHKYIRQGFLVRAVFPGHERSSGVTRESFENFVAASKGDPKALALLTHPKATKANGHAKQNVATTRNPRGATK